MANCQYKLNSADSWTDIPAYALHGMLEGGPALNYPEADEYDGLGRRCAAVGKPTIIAQSELMTGCGFTFWNSFFGSNANATSASCWVKAFDPRESGSGALTWKSCSGYITRPTFRNLRIGGDTTASGTTYYRDVEIRVESCDVGVS